MELDPTTGLYDHGARQRNPIHLNWLNPDPLTEKYPMYSTYSYCYSNPVGFVDLDGIAQEISENLPNTKIIAPTNTVEQNTRTGELTVPNGDWIVLKGGKEVDRYDGDWQPKSEPTKSDILFDNKKMTFLEKIENIFKFNNNENDK